MKSMNLKQRLFGVVLAVGAAVMSGVASAQSTGTGTATTIDSSTIVTSINAVGPVIVDIGGAVLAIVVLAWGYKTVKGFIGR